MALCTTLATCQELGVPPAADKVEGPAPLLTFLGIELNTMTMSLGLPEDTLASLCTLLRRVHAKCICNAHQLQLFIESYMPGHATREGLSEQPLPFGQ